MCVVLVVFVVWMVGLVGFVGVGVVYVEVVVVDLIDVVMWQCFVWCDWLLLVGQIQCMGEVQQQWQIVMDGVYQCLLKDVLVDVKCGWQDSQCCWFMWCKDEVLLLKVVYDMMCGIVYVMLSVDLQLQLVCDCVLVLCGVVDCYVLLLVVVLVVVMSGVQGGVVVVVVLVGMKLVNVLCELVVCCV